MQFKVASVDSLIIYFGNEINEQTALQVKLAYDNIKGAQGLIDVIPSYTSILVVYDIFTHSYDALCERLIKQINSSTLTTSTNSKLIQIGVYYGLEAGLDLPAMSEQHSLGVDEIVQIHTSQTYLVYAIGFAPGFAYLGSVNGKIATPRLATPRKLVQKGSVAIADTQTAIYPEDSPGGWNIVGKSTFNAYNKTLPSLTPFAIGDKVQFVSISKQEFLQDGGVL